MIGELDSSISPSWLTKHGLKHVATRAEGFLWPVPGWQGWGAVGRRVRAKVHHIFDLENG